MSPEFEKIFLRLQNILQQHAKDFSVTSTAGHYSLEGTIGPATLQAWGGKLKRKKIPVAWVEIGKTYISYHLMGLYGNKKLIDNMSRKLLMHLQGKTCFNFKKIDEKLFKELEQLTVRGIEDLRKSGFIQ